MIQLENRFGRSTFAGLVLVADAWRELTQASLCYSSHRKHDNYWKAGEREREREKWRVTAGRRKQRACVKLASRFSRQVSNSVTLLQVNRRGSQVNSEFLQS